MSVTELATSLTLNEKDEHVLDLVLFLPIPEMTDRRPATQVFLRTHWKNARIEAFNELIGQCQNRTIPFLDKVHSHSIPIHSDSMPKLAHTLTGDRNNESWLKDVRAVFGLGKASGKKGDMRYKFTPTELLQLYVGCTAVRMGLEERKNGNKDFKESALENSPVKQV